MSFIKTTIHSNGTYLGVCWLGLFCAVIGVVLWLLFTAVWGLLAFLVLLFLSTLACRLHRIGYTVEVTDRECIVRRGFLLRSIVKVPLRYLTATSCFSTPLSRRLGVGVLMLFSSGRLTVMIGLPLADINAMRSLMAQRQV